MGSLSDKIPKRWWWRKQSGGELWGCHGWLTVCCDRANWTREPAPETATSPSPEGALERAQERAPEKAPERAPERAPGRWNCDRAMWTPEPAPATAPERATGRWIQMKWQKKPDHSYSQGHRYRCWRSGPGFLSRSQLWMCWRQGSEPKKSPSKDETLKLTRVLLNCLLLFFVFIFMKNRHLQYWSIGLTKHLPTTILSKFVIYLLI